MVDVGGSVGINPMLPGDIPCEQCFRNGSRVSLDSPECREAQNRWGCHLCDRRGRWRTKNDCPYAGPERGQLRWVADASAVRDTELGDTVPHMRHVDIRVHAVTITGDIRLCPEGVNLGQQWWHRKIGVDRIKEVVIIVEDHAYCKRFASGARKNCLIDTLRSCLDLVLNVEMVRARLEEVHLERGTPIVKDGFLDFQLHAVDISRIFSEPPINY